MNDLIINKFSSCLENLSKELFYTKDLNKGRITFLVTRNYIYVNVPIGTYEANSILATFDELKLNNINESYWIPINIQLPNGRFQEVRIDSSTKQIKLYSTMIINVSTPIFIPLLRKASIIRA